MKMHIGYRRDLTLDMEVEGENIDACYAKAEAIRDRTPLSEWVDRGTPIRRNVYPIWEPAVPSKDPSKVRECGTCRAALCDTVKTLFGSFVLRSGETVQNIDLACRLHLGHDGDHSWDLHA